MRYKYKDPLGCEREIEGEYNDIIDLLEYLWIEDIADKVTVNVGAVRDAIKNLDDSETVTISAI
jgi:hypothetical protein